MIHNAMIIKIPIQENMETETSRANSCDLSVKSWRRKAKIFISTRQRYFESVVFRTFTQATHKNKFAGAYTNGGEYLKPFWAHGIQNTNIPYNKQLLRLN